MKTRLKPHMKFRAFTTGLGLIGAIACLTTIKMADAQTASPEQNTEPAVYIQTERELACDRLTDELGEVAPNGSSSGFDPFKGITLSAKQQVAYDKFDAEKDAKSMAATANVETAEYLDGYLAFTQYVDTTPPEVAAFGVV